MKTALRNSIFVALGIFLSAGSAYAAQWVDVNGNNAVIEYPGNTTNSAAGSAASYYKGWGFEFTQKAGTQNWVHAVVPSSGTQQADTIYVRYFKQYADASIGTIDIYNGEVKIKTVTAPAGAAGVWNAFSINLGGILSFGNGLGVSLNIIPSPGKDTRFNIGDVGALFQ
jgi:hypothetical protein